MNQANICDSGKGIIIYNQISITISSISVIDLK